MNLGSRTQNPTDSQCQKDRSDSDSICFCEVCRANRTRKYAASLPKTDEDGCANPEPKSTPSSKKSKLMIDPKLAKEYPFSKISPKHKERFC